MTVRDIDKGMKKLLKALATEASLSVGVHQEEGSATREDGATIADVAVFQEFGTSTIPARSFVRGWFDGAESENANMIKASAKAVAARQVKDTGQAMERLGVRFSGDMKKRIIAGLSPELADSTVERKGSSTPLIDQGQLIGAITHKVTTE